MHLYVLGGHQRSRWLRPLHPERRFDKALILRLDTDSGQVERMVEYRSPADVKAHPEASDVFTSGTLLGSTLYVGTYSEILVFELPAFRRLHCISSPVLNNVHHVSPTPRGTVLAVSSGLDMVFELDFDGRVVREWEVLKEKPWTRFSPTVDYRTVESTKPHLSHPNFVFELGEEIWATRFHQRDAVCLTNERPSINIGIERPHDGLLREGRLYFTTVDGHVITVEATSLEIVSTVDLKRFRDYPFTGPSWCRGIHLITNELVCVGFTRIRKTRLMQAVNWIKHGLREADPPTHLGVFNLAQQECLQVIDLEPHGLNILFGVLPAL